MTLGLYFSRFGIGGALGTPRDPFGDRFGGFCGTLGIILATVGSSWCFLGGPCQLLGPTRDQWAHIWVPTLGPVLAHFCWVPIDPYSLRGYRGRPCPSPGYPRYLPLSRICRVATCQAGPGWPDLSGGHMPGWPRLARGGSRAPKWGRKTWFCRGMVSKLEIMGFPATQMDCMVPRRPLGKPVSPQTPLKNGPLDFSQFGEIWGGSPWI